jgi:hypothetical protein
MRDFRCAECIGIIHNLQPMLRAWRAEGLRSRLALPVMQLDRGRDESAWLAAFPTHLVKLLASRCFRTYENDLENDLNDLMRK